MLECSGFESEMSLKGFSNALGSCKRRVAGLKKVCRFVLPYVPSRFVRGFEVSRIFIRVSFEFDGAKCVCCRGFVVSEIQEYKVFSFGAFGYPGFRSTSEGSVFNWF